MLHPTKHAGLTKHPTIVDKQIVLCDLCSMWLVLPDEYLLGKFLVDKSLVFLENAGRLCRDEKHVKKTCNMLASVVIS